MKSLALNFIVISFILLVSVSAIRPSTLATTTQPPSLRAPQHFQATTPTLPATAKFLIKTESASKSESGNEAKTVRRVRPLVNRQSSSSSSSASSLSKVRFALPSSGVATSLAHANSLANMTKFDSARLVRRSDAISNRNSPSRQSNLVIPAKPISATKESAGNVTPSVTNTSKTPHNDHNDFNNNDVDVDANGNHDTINGNVTNGNNNNVVIKILNETTKPAEKRPLSRKSLLYTTSSTTASSSLSLAKSNNVSSLGNSYEHQLMSGFRNNQQQFQHQHQSQPQPQHQHQHQQQHNQPERNYRQRFRPESEKSFGIADDGDRKQKEHAPQPNDSTKTPQQTLKSPRMIQRLVAGHIQNAQGHSTYRISAVTRNNSTTSTTTSAPSTSFLARRKQPIMRSSYREEALEAQLKTSSVKPLSEIKRTPATENNIDHDDDEALLDEPGDFDNWDNGILRLSAGSGKENTGNTKKGKDDSKKTLSDQVRDGKYGLIEKELFSKRPKRPGVLSYLPNKEFPHDNDGTFGGLNEEDIWLAEDHLLVIKGGSLNEDNQNEPWAPIDDYDAPPRQIKIPNHPKIPPPFPVQLEENGPVQLIGNNKFTVVYPVANETIPIYTTRTETKHSSSSSESDDEKNLITRPGSSEDTKDEGPAYIYPAPYPPWVFHNQTFVNPLLSKALPLSFPILGPFPFKGNGSLEDSKKAEDFDEDDPNLYYPPAYSFVYKNNYSNPVAPGPLVPGIVLPPPPDQFSRLESPTKVKTSTQGPTYIRQRPTTTTTTTSTTTSTTTTSTTTPRPSPSPRPTPSPTTQLPFGRVITKISQYTPKTIIITPSPPVTTSVSYAITRGPPKTTTTSTLPPFYEHVPVPVAVPVPIYPVDYQPTPRPQFVTFVPTTPEAPKDNSNPIYYEYFEAKRQPSTSHIIDEFISTTAQPPPPPAKPIKLYAANKPFKAYSNRGNYAQKIPQSRPIDNDNIVYITPKPPQINIVKYKARPLDFESEVTAIRERLNYYKSQQLRDNNIPRAPKSKPIYEYNFDSTKNSQAQPKANEFQPPADYDEEPFRPMVTYSPAADDENSFKAIAYDKADNEIVNSAQSPTQEESVKPVYQTTTTLVPVKPETKHRSRSKKVRLGSKYLQSQNGDYQQPLQQGDYNYVSTDRNINPNQDPWSTVDLQKVQPQSARPPQQQRFRSERLQVPQQQHYITPNRGFNGYIYRQPSRQNNRFYAEPFQPPQRKIINYRPQQQPPPPPQAPPQQRPQHNQHHQQQVHQQQWSLENDTYVNYLPNRPPLNPEAEFINPYQPGPYEVYTQPVHRQPTPPPLNHQSQYYAQSHLINQHQPQAPLPYHQQSIPLHRDVLVNYRQPLPPLNPDSEFISHPAVVHNQGNPYYPSNNYRVPQLDNSPVGPSNIYYISPKYRRASNNNYRNGDNNSNGNSNGS